MRRVDLSDPRIEYDPDDPDGFGSGRDRVGRRLEAKDTGASLYELPPGQSVCPYHYEYGEEEWLLVIEGRASVRTPEGTEQVGPMELVFLPRGPEGAHEIRNDTEDRCGCSSGRRWSIRAPRPTRTATRWASGRATSPRT